MFVVLYVWETYMEGNTEINSIHHTKEYAQIAMKELAVRRGMTTLTTETDWYITKRTGELTKTIEIREFEIGKDYI